MIANLSGAVMKRPSNYENKEGHARFIRGQARLLRLSYRQRACARCFEAMTMNIGAMTCAAQSLPSSNEPDNMAIVCPWVIYQVTISLTCHFWHQFCWAFLVREGSKRHLADLRSQAVTSQYEQTYWNSDGNLPRVGAAMPMSCVLAAVRP
jgi:hypothetical protein